MLYHAIINISLQELVAKNQKACGNPPKITERAILNPSAKKNCLSFPTPPVLNQPILNSARLLYLQTDLIDPSMCHVRREINMFHCAGEVLDPLNGYKNKTEFRR